MGRIISILVLLLGIGVFIFGNRMSYEAAQGETKILETEANAQNSRRPIVGPVRKNAKAQNAAATQKKIGQKEVGIVKSQVTANWLRGTGIVLFIVGGGYLLFSFSSKKRG